MIISTFIAATASHIAREAEVPLGNVYYHFKTKDEIGEAIVELRLEELCAQRQRWSEAGSPKDRLCACGQDVFENKDFLAEHGCAVATFCSELHKAGGSVATRVTEIFDRAPKGCNETGPWFRRHDEYHKR